MKRKMVCGAMAMLLVAGVAVAATLFLTVTALPYSEAGGGATVDGPSHLYLTISPSAEIHKPKSIVTVYEGGDEIWTGHAVAVSEKLIKSYSADAQRRYTLEIQEMDGTTIVGQLLYD